MLIVKNVDLIVVYIQRKLSIMRSIGRNPLKLQGGLTILTSKFPESGGGLVNDRKQLKN